MGAGAGAVAGLGPPSTPKLDGAKVSRAGSRVSGELPAPAAVVGGGNTTAAGSGAVPVPVRGAAALAAGFVVAAAGLLLPRTGGGGGPIDLGPPACGAASGDGAATGALEASGALAGRGAGRGGGFGDSVTDDSARSGEYATAHAFALAEHYKEISDGG
jgi:hypothetical protein